MTSYYTERNITNFVDLPTLYRILEAKLAMGQSLPEWTHDIFPYGKLRDALITFYSLLGDDERLTNLNSGMFIQKIFYNIVYNKLSNY